MLGVLLVAVNVYAATSDGPPPFPGMVTNTTAKPLNSGRAAMTFASPAPAAAAAVVVPEDPPVYLTVTWQPSIVDSNHGGATGYIVWTNVPPGPIGKQLETNQPPAVILAEGPRTFYVTATNSAGSSVMSLGYTWPKPLTNEITLSATTNVWPPIIWTNPVMPTRFWTVKFATNPATATAVFGPTARGPWVPWTNWPVLNTSNKSLRISITNRVY